MGVLLDPLHNGHSPVPLDRTGSGSVTIRTMFFAARRSTDVVGPRRVCHNALEQFRLTRAVDGGQVEGLIFHTCILFEFHIAQKFQATGAGFEPASRRSKRRILPLDDPAIICLDKKLKRFLIFS